MEDKGQLSLVNVLKNRTNLPDLDNIKSVGCYYYAGSTGILHRPFDADGSMFYLLAFGCGTDSRVCQLAVETGGKIAARSCAGGRWTAWTYYTSTTDLMNSEPLDLTYINNKYVGIESFNRVRSAKITPTLAILSLNLAVENFTHGDDFINIGKINGATVLVTALANVPAQNGKGVLTYQIDYNGNIAIYNDTSETINSFCRVVIPLVGRF